MAPRPSNPLRLAPSRPLLALRCHRPSNTPFGVFRWFGIKLSIARPGGVVTWRMKHSSPPSDLLQGASAMRPAGGRLTPSIHLQRAATACFGGSGQGPQPLPGRGRSGFQGFAVSHNTLGLERYMDIVRKFVADTP